MSKAIVFNVADTLTNMWIRLESLICNSPMIKEPTVRLSIERHGQLMRIFFDGRPIRECTMDQKIEATEHLGAFYVLYRESNSLLVFRCNTAINKVEEYMKKFEELEK